MKHEPARAPEGQPNGMVHRKPARRTSAPPMRGGESRRNHDKGGSCGSSATESAPWRPTRIASAASCLSAPFGLGAPLHSITFRAIRTASFLAFSPLTCWRGNRRVLRHSDACTCLKSTPRCTHRFSQTSAMSPPPSSHNHPRGGHSLKIVPTPRLNSASDPKCFDRYDFSRPSGP